MNDEIKEILDNLKNKDNDIKGINFLKYQDLTRGEIDLLLDYITTLQEKYDEANNAINWWSNKAKELQEENETLHENNQNMQEEMARVCEENERLKEEHNQLRNCRKYDLNLISNLKHDKVRYEEIIDKAIEYIDKQKKKMYKSRNKIALFILMKLENILQNGSDSQ